MIACPEIEHQKYEQATAVFTSLINGISNAFDTNPGTSCDVATSVKESMNTGGERIPDTQNIYLFRKLQQMRVSGLVCPAKFAPQK